MRAKGLAMGFDFFMIPIRNGDDSEISLADFEDVFAKGALDPRRPLDAVEYADGRGEIYGAEKRPIRSLMFSHFGGRTFWCRVLELADRIGSMMLWPGDEDLAITDLRLLDHLPRELKTDGWRPHLVRRVQRLVDVVGIVGHDLKPWRLDEDWSL